MGDKRRFTKKLKVSQIEALKNATYQISGLVAIFTYQLDFATEKFEQNDILVRTLTDYGRLISVAQELHYIDSQDLDLLASWRKAPGSWKPN